MHEILKDMVQTLQMLNAHFTQDSNVEGLFSRSPPSHETSLFFSNNLFSLGFALVQDDFQLDCTKMVDEANGSVILGQLRDVLLGRVIISD